MNSSEQNKMKGTVREFQGEVRGDMVTPPCSVVLREALL